MPTERNLTCEFDGKGEGQSVGSLYDRNTHQLLQNNNMDLLKNLNKLGHKF